MAAGFFQFFLFSYEDTFMALVSLPNHDKEIINEKKHQFNKTKTEKVLRINC